MSLSRVASMESYEHARGISPSREPRKMSFNPVETWVPPAAHEEPVGAFEVPKTKRLLQIIVAVIYCIPAAGPVFGYAALKPVLVKEGVYHDRCPGAQVMDHLVSPGACYEQEIRMFTVAAVATNVCALPVGTILDRYGPRVSGLIGSVAIAIGAALFAFAGQFPFDGYIPGYFFLALGGPFVFISTFQLSNAFPTHSGLILAILTGAFDSSSALFLVFRLVFEHTRGAFNIQKFFLAYLIVPVFIFVAQIFLMPKHSYKTMGELVKQAEDSAFDEHESDEDMSDTSARLHMRDARRERRESIVSEITSLLGPKGGDVHVRKEAHKNTISGVWGALHGRTAIQQIWTPWFWLVTLFTMVQMTRNNYFVATIRPQYTYLLHSYEDAKRINEIFDVALPVGGLVAIPMIGLVLDHTSTPFVLAVLVFFATLIGILGIIGTTGAAYCNIILFVLYRPFYYTTVSDYASKVFGFATFGKVYGLIICLSGFFNFSQSALDAMTHKAFRGDPRPANILLCVLALLVGLLLCSYVWHKSRNMKRELLEEEADGATESLMPGAGFGDL
ncbi:MAG: hypothetical protein M1834_005951 [Cirrosporium novae-zelandiae]|nr:MAG: hypothetical protein M1834_005951 [Cirrosporium novae-zelandiae]